MSKLEQVKGSTHRTFTGILARIIKCRNLNRQLEETLEIVLNAASEKKKGEP